MFLFEEMCAMIFSSDGGNQIGKVLSKRVWGRRVFVPYNLSENLTSSQNLKFNEVEQCFFFFFKKDKKCIYEV